MLKINKYNSGEKEKITSWSSHALYKGNATRLPRQIHPFSIHQTQHQSPLVLTLHRWGYHHLSIVAKPL